MAVLCPEHKIDLSIIIPIGRTRACRMSGKFRLRYVPFEFEPHMTVFFLDILIETGILPVNKKIKPAIPVPIDKTYLTTP